MTEMTSAPKSGNDLGPVLAEYTDRLRKQEIVQDEAQYNAVQALDSVARKLGRTEKSKGGLFSFLRLGSDQPTRRQNGLYLFGSVGRGKTMLMDMFFETVPTTHKRRLHFHEFMAETHDRISKARKHVDGDPLPTVAAGIAKDTRLLCFDELHVTDIADAMILSRLFKGLFENGLTLVATSNAHPDALYKDGLNRQLFKPFIGLVHEHMVIHEVGAAKDFRLEKLAGRKLYFVPADRQAREQMDAHWHRLTGDHPGAPMDLELKGRSVHVPLASMGVARFAFDDLCAKPLGSLDFLRIAHEFHTVLIDDIPKLGRENRNEARRFINLIDTLYDSRVSLLASAQAQPHDLYTSGDGADLFARTSSRLTEMRSDAYLKSRT